MRSVGARFLLLSGTCAALFSAFVLYRTYVASHDHATELVSQQTTLAMEFNLAIRDYAAKQIRPVMESLICKGGFIPETMSTSFISRNIFEEVRKRFPDYIIRFASENPRNPMNKANADELKMIEFFRKNPSIERTTKDIEIGGRRYVAQFAPKWMKQECMQCHGDPKDAPPDLIKRYGATASFHRAVGDFAGLDTIAIPVATVQQALASTMRWQSLSLASGLVLLFLSLSIVFRLAFARRLEAMAEHFRRISENPEGSMMTPVAVTGNDEITVLGRAFNTLIEQLRASHGSLEERVKERTAELAKANDNLRQEVAERQRAEEALKQRTEELDRFFGVNLDLLCIADTDGCFRRLNPAWYKMLGYTQEELVGRRFFDFIHPDDIASTQNALVLLSSQHDVIDFINRYRCKDGSYRWIEWMSTPSGHLIYAAARDITERKRNEEEKLALQEDLAQAHKMEAVGQLAGGVAHDFNNLLQVISSHVDLALADMPCDSPAHNGILEVRKAAERATSLVRQLLVFSRKGDLRLGRVDLNAVIEGLMKMVGRIIGEHIELSFTAGCDLSAVRADAGQMEQVIMNLCVNARDAMPQGGRLTIETKNVHLDSQFCQRYVDAKEGEYVLLSVTDTGVGISAEAQEHIFEPFFTTKGVGKGTGLGLATVYAIINRHGGIIDFSSAEGGGAVFKIFLPATEGCAESPQAESVENPATPAGESQTILFAEDDEQVRTVTASVLERAGYRVLTAQDGDDAIALFEQHANEIDLALLDVLMPKKTGLAVLDAMRALKPDIPVLFSSGYSADVLRSDLTERGDFEIIHKPFRLRTLLEKIAEIARRSSHRKEV